MRPKEKSDAGSTGIELPLVLAVLAVPGAFAIPAMQHTVREAP